MEKKVLIQEVDLDDQTKYEIHLQELEEEEMYWDTQNSIYEDYLEEDYYCEEEIQKHQLEEWIIGENILDDVEHQVRVEREANDDYPIMLKIFFGIATLKDLRKDHFNDDYGLPDWIAPEDLGLERFVIPNSTYYPLSRCLFVQDTWFGGGTAYFIGDTIQQSFLVSAHHDKAQWVFYDYRQFMKDGLTVWERIKNK